MVTEGLKTQQTAKRKVYGIALFSALLAGTLLAWSLPPYAFFPAGFIALVPFFYASLYISLPIILLLSIFISWICAVWLMGSLFDAHGLTGFTLFSVSLLLTGATASLSKRLDSIGAVFCVGAVGVLSEWLATFPAMPFNLALTQWNNLPFLQFAALTGVWGVSFMLWASAAAVAGAIQAKQITPALKWLIILLILIHFGGALVYQFGARDGTPVRVAAIQPVETWRNSAGMRPSNQQSASLKGEAERLCEEAVQKGAQLLVLPETYLDISEGERLARDLQVYIAHGFYENSRNGAVLFRAGGFHAGTYYKIHPYGSEAELIIPGERAFVFDTPLVHAGMLICFDNMFTDVTRSLARQDAQIILQPNLDPRVPGWMIHYLHAAMTPLRAVENRVPFVRADWEGCSQIVDAYGKVLAQAPAGEPAAIVETLRLRESGTLYTRWGDYFVWLCGLGIAFALIRAKKPGKI